MAMRHLILGLAVASAIPTVFAFPVFCDETVVTTDGRQVWLKDDGTYEVLKNPYPLAPVAPVVPVAPGYARGYVYPYGAVPPGYGVSPPGYGYGRAAPAPAAAKPTAAKPTAPEQEAPEQEADGVLGTADDWIDEERAHKPRIRK